MAVGRVVASAGATAAPSALLARRVASGGWWSDAQQSAVALELDRLYSRALALRSPRYSRSLSAQGNSVPSGKPVAWETADGRSGSSAASAWTTIVRSGGISGHATLSAWARLGWLTASQLPKAAHEFDEVQGTGEEVSTEMGGVYIHGPVGSGKTALMNLLIEACHAADVPIRRLHFHQLMREAHAMLNQKMQVLEIGRALGTGSIADVSATCWSSNDAGVGARATPGAPPLSAHAAREAISLLAVDEFQITDIADAAILSRLTEGILSSGCLLIATSNRAPLELYKNGLNRHVYIPAFSSCLRESGVRVIELASENGDYRRKSVHDHRARMASHAREVNDGAGDFIRRYELESGGILPAGSVGESDAALDSGAPPLSGGERFFLYRDHAGDRRNYGGLDEQQSGQRVFNSREAATTALRTVLRLKHRPGPMVMSNDADRSHEDRIRSDSYSGATASSCNNAICIDAFAVWRTAWLALGGERRLRLAILEKDLDRAVSFDDLCVSPLGAEDYLKLADLVDAVGISSVPRFTPEMHNEARRFITFLDIWYDQQRHLYMSASAPPSEMFSGLETEALRTATGWNANDAQAALPSRGYGVRRADLRGGDGASSTAAEVKVVGFGGSSSSHGATFLGDSTEWSATGRLGVSLAALSGLQDAAFAQARAASRLEEMLFNREYGMPQ